MEPHTEKQNLLGICHQNMDAELKLNLDHAVLSF